MRVSVIHLLSLCVVLVSFAVCCPCGAAAGDEPAEVAIDPAKVYAAKCARCHGDSGQGVADGHNEPLRGTQTIDELTKLIVETMPEEDPADCVGEEARLLAEYIHKTFYSQAANDRPVVELSRLTVDQYRNVIADTIGRFAPGQPREQSDDDRPRRRSRRVATEEPVVPGLRGEYFQSRGMSKADRLAHYSSDTHLEFDFGTGSPTPTILPDQFSIIWEGGLIAGATGHYEFRITTQNGARLYLNLDPQEGLRKLRDDSSAAGQQALIDGWVSSGKMRELSARVFLLGGRTYPIRLEFFKYLEDTASVKLEWKPPHGAWQVLDHNNTQSVRTPRVYVCETPFPADDHSLGYERGSSVSPEWQAATTSAAVAAAQEVVDRLPALAGFSDDEDADPDDRAKRASDFVLNFAATAYRRPLTDSERELLAAIMSASSENPEAAVRRAVATVLMSPHFLYTDLTPADEQPSQHAVASRLALTLWDSIPDRELSDAADRGELQTPEQIRQHASRMMEDGRAKAKMAGFFRKWLELEERDLAKDKAMFPEFDEAVIADLRKSLELFIDRVVWSRESDYRQLLLADYLVLNDPLRELYAADLPDGSAELDEQEIRRRARTERVASEFQPVEFPEGQRSGVLTHPYLLSAYAYHNNTSPIHRGVFLTRNIVGRALNPPPMAVAFKDNEFAADLTMREKVTQLTSDKACMSCHSIINPLGFTLESFDAVGRFRSVDNSKPVDTRTQYTTEAGETLEFARAKDIAEFAVSHDEAHRAFVTQVFQHLVKQNPMAYGEQTIEALSEQFEKDQFNIQNLWVQIATRTAAGGSDEKLLSGTP
ncbi:MAG: DUF1592 domain-containing protein [Planctomycetaceae bacterium]